MPEKPHTPGTAGTKLAEGAFSAWPLPPGPRAAAVARAVVRSVLDELDLPSEIVSDAQTIISELATNAVVHGDRESAEVWAYLSRHPSPRLNLKVFDAAPWRGSGAADPAATVTPTAPITGEQASDAYRGRGLMLVNALTGEAGGCWGIHPTRRRLGPDPVPGKAVYFTVPLPKSSAAALPPPAPGPLPERLRELAGARGLRSLVSLGEATVVHFGAGLWVWVKDRALLCELPGRGLVRYPPSDAVEVVEQMVRLCEESTADGAAPLVPSWDMC
ncbi:ATP-binding protein [Actinomadura luteofluorescens]|uniref:ATP-binding protein n=1 Tax=Actinomadura luteofluorescens TaxID=46163 RepID=UPI001FE62626|nr:ATP-binding protein [Actinomadura luteofluorescens]